ncbi:nucleoside 2-deoxyribosyltransferase [Lentilactobacillus senioris]|uniref:nucleoside 2-deoxyribosyltransferase n=1 Tax=Lentilactobacillus senioris TaxID=931534 RepID=UPI003D2722E8
MKNIYLAAPFFSDEQNERVTRVEEALAANPTVGEVFSPRKNQLEQYEMGTKKWAQEIFKYDTSKIDWCDVVVAVVDFDDDDVDSGTAFEIGYAYSTNKPLVIFHEKDTILNLMVSESLKAHLTTDKQLQDYNFEDLPSVPYDGKVI